MDCGACRYFVSAVLRLLCIKLYDALNFKVLLTPRLDFFNTREGI